MCVRSFVRPQHGDNSMGGLNRVLALTKARWLCKSHAFVGPNNEALEGYVRSRGGSIHLQMATITIDFSSLSEANAFAAAFFQGGRFFDLSINFTWSISKKELQTSLQQICKCQPSVLQIEGKAFTVEQGPREYSGDPLAFQLGTGTESTAQVIILPSHPLPSESYIYLGDDGRVFGFLFKGMVDKPNVKWKVLVSNLDAIDEGLCNDTETDDQRRETKWTELLRIMRPLLDQGLRGVDIFGTSTKLQCRLGVKDGTIMGVTQLHLPSDIFNPRTTEYPALQRLVIGHDTVDVVKSLFAVMMKSPKLQLIEISSQELELFGTIATLFCSWPGTRTVHITLFEHDSGNGGAALIKLQIGRMISNESWPVAINILEWHYDNVSEVLEDWDTFLLYLATQCV